MARDAEEFLRGLGIPRHDEREAGPSERPPGDGDSTLADLDRLRGEAERLQQQFSVPAAGSRGRDSTGSVCVTVGGDGCVVDVEIDRSWRTAVGEQGLNAAILQAVMDATMRRLVAWSEGVAGQSPGAVADHPSSVRRPQPAEASRSGAPSDSAEARRMVHEVLSLLEDVESELDVLERRVGERARQQVVGRSPSHLVKVTVVGGGEVVDVDIQRRLMQRSDERGIAKELLAAFRAAYERAGSLKLDDLLGNGRLARLHALGADPDALLRGLGLGRH
jgi:DNA-binding protein YbaB